MCKINGFDFVAALNNAANFVKTQREARFTPDISSTYIHVWQDDRGFCVFATDDRNAFLQRVPKKEDIDLSVDQFAISLKELGKVRDALSGDIFRATIRVENGGIWINNVKIQNQPLLPNQTGKDIYDKIVSSYSIVGTLEIPGQGYYLPIQGFHKAFKALATLGGCDAVKVECLKMAPLLSNASYPCFHFVHPNMEIWVMSYKQEQEIAL